jgi:acyl-CoA synthetase (AMP-forming)/AMP-acid ligase II
MPDSLVDLLDASVRRQPAAPALAWRGARWSYAELASAAACSAAFLERRSIGPGDRVGLLFRNCPQYVAFYYGILALGAVAVPLNPHERANVLARQLEHCGARAVLGDTSHPEWGAIAAQAAAAGSEVVAFTVEEGAAALEQFLDQLGAVTVDASGLAGRRTDADALASLIYTSGTTGRPKGVMLSHRNLAANTESIVRYLELGPGDRGLVVLPFHFSYGNSVLHTHLAAGAELLLEESLAYPHLILQRMQEAEVTGFSGVPSTFALLLSRCNLADYNLSRLRYLTQAGGPMPRPNISKLRELLPQVKLYIMYGQTEAAARLSYLPPERLGDKLGSVGIGIPGVELAVRLINGTPAAPGEIGEIAARGPNVMLGYWKDETASRQVLHEGWLRTGDLGHFDAEGFLFIDGRAIEMIKVGAFRVSPQEIEEVIAALPGVEEVGVTSIPDELLGQAIKAVVVARAGAQLDARAVKAHCRRQLAAYKVPKEVEFAGTLPRTATGKVQRLRLS